MTAVLIFPQWIPVVLFLHQPWPWFWLEFSSLFFLSLAKRRIKRLKKTLKKLCTCDSYIFLYIYIYTHTQTSQEKQMYYILFKVSHQVWVRSWNKNFNNFCFPNQDWSCQKIHMTLWTQWENSIETLVLIQKTIQHWYRRDFNSWKLLYLGLKNWFTVDFNALSERFLAFYILLFVIVLCWHSCKSRL